MRQRRLRDYQQARQPAAAREFIPGIAGSHLRIAVVAMSRKLLNA